MAEHRDRPDNEPLNVLQETVQITSSAFEHGDYIPTRYTCDGEDISPPLQIGGLPQEAKSLALIVEDPDAPVGTWVHWAVWNLPPDLQELSPGKIPPQASEGVNDFDRAGYGGPCPPSGVHRYYFNIFALDTVLNLAKGSRRKELDRAMKGHIIGYGSLMGRYQRQSGTQHL
jgi:Raf kinase inhibitor-like YbhB/YbcL family protein